MVLPLPEDGAATTKALANGILPERRSVPIEHFAPVGSMAHHDNGRGGWVVFRHKGSGLIQRGGLHLLVWKGGVGNDGHRVFGRPSAFHQSLSNLAQVL